LAPAFDLLHQPVTAERLLSEDQQHRGAHVAARPPPALPEGRPTEGRTSPAAKATGRAATASAARAAAMAPAARPGHCEEAPEPGWSKCVCVCHRDSPLY